MNNYFNIIVVVCFLISSADGLKMAHRATGQLEGRTEPSRCNGTGALFIHFGLGCHGGESLEEFFDNSGFQSVFFNTGLDSYPRWLWQQIRDDWKDGNDHLPRLQQTVADAKQKNPCGNVFLGDIKPNHKDWFSNSSESKPTFEELFRRLEKAFPDAVWLWLIRHPDNFATSLTHFNGTLPAGADQEQADEFLRYVRREHAQFHCSASQHFGDRTLGKPGGNVKGNGIGDVVQLNLEQLDWPLFVQQLRDASGYQGYFDSEQGMPHTGHHPPTWTYPKPDTNNWNPWNYLAEVCGPAETSEFGFFANGFPGDDEEDDGL